jgi:hypothetical protein
VQAFFLKKKAIETDDMSSVLIFLEKKYKQWGSVIL